MQIAGSDRRGNAQAIFALALEGENLLGGGACTVTRPKGWLSESFMK
jgi:hypothetical protein